LIGIAAGVATTCGFGYLAVRNVDFGIFRDGLAHCNYTWLAPPAILTLAAAQGTTVRTLLLLFFYSLGLGLPIFLLGLGMRWAMGASRFISRNYRWIAGTGGVLMVTIGVLLISGVWVRLLAPLLRLINRFTPPI